MQPQSAVQLAPDTIRAIAREAYIYGFPLVDNYRIQYSYFVDKNDPEFKAPWNQVYNNARVYTPEDRAIQSPNSDTPYSYFGADLRAEPLVLTMPAVEPGRYYSAQFIDLYTFNFAYVGTRTTGNGPGSFLLAGPLWRGDRPAGIKGVIRCETDFAFVLYRTQLFNSDDIANVMKIQEGYNVQTLSAFTGRPPVAKPAVHFPKPLKADEKRSSLEFFNLLNFVLQFCPTHPSETELMARLGGLGIGAGRKFDGQALAPEVRKALEAGIADAWRVEEDVHNQIASGQLSASDLFGNREFMKNRYAYRMAAAASGIYGNSKEEAIYHVYYADLTGQTLDTAANDYTLRFAPGQLPPVNAFWSVTLYEMPSQLLSANPINRYLINSPMLPDLKRDSDGGVTIHIQSESPGNENEPNWLPAPAGPIKVALRLYAPKPDVASGDWTAPPMQNSTQQ